MIIRSKLSFSAFIKGKTIHELFISQILDTYNSLKQDKLIVEDPEKERRRIEVYDNIQNNQMGVIKALMA